MIAVYIVGGLVAALILLLVVLALLGTRIPVEHVASMSLRLPRTPPERVWALLDDAPGFASWAWGVNRVEKLPDRDGRPAFRQTMGRNSFVLETTRRDGPRLLERTISDDHGPFSGSWTYQLRPEAGGCVVTLTERGRVKGAIPRAVMKHLMGYHTYIRKHLLSLAAKLCETVEPVVETLLEGELA